MRETTIDFKNGILAHERQLCVKIVVNGRQEIDDHYIKSVVIHEVSNGQEMLSMGTICANSVKISLFDPGNIVYMNSEIEVFIGLMLDEIEWVSMGTFVMSDMTRNNDYEVVLEGYDRIIDLNRDYVPHIDYPNSIENVVNDILDQCQLSLKDMVFDDIEIAYPLETTCLQMLSYMASLMGMNVRMNRDHLIEFFWYEGSYVINDQYIFEGSYKITHDLITISSLTSGSEENVISVGSGYGITFDNPYMSEERLNVIYQKVNGFSYRPCQLKWRGDPSVEVCDLIQINDENVILMEQVFSFDGGMNCAIECVGQNEQEITMSRSPIEIKLKKLYQTLLQSFQETTQTLLGQKGGYYTIDYTDGYPSGWTIMNTPTLRDDTHLWKMSMGGFGYSEDGGKTFQNYAFDLNGNLNANALTTGVIQGNGFDLNLESGDIKIGERNSEGVIEHPVLSYSSNEGLHIEAMSQVESNVSTLMNSISTSFSVNYVNAQTYDEAYLSYYPDYQIQPLMITAIVKDDLRNMIVEGNYVWKRRGQGESDFSDLIDGEIAKGNVLMISHNLSENVEYKVEVSVIGEKGYLFTDENSIFVNVNVLSGTLMNNEICSMTCSDHHLIKNDDVSFLTLVPYLNGCSFDAWFYSIDLGKTYSLIDIMSQMDDGMYSTNVEGITYDGTSHELYVSSQSPCFDSINAVVFKLKADVDQASDTFVITRENVVETQDHLMRESIEQLKQNYYQISQDIDAINGTVSKKITQVEEKNSEDIQTVYKKISEVESSASSIVEKFSSLEKSVNDNESDLKTLITYIQRSEKGIEVGEEDANIKTLMASDHFAIVFNEDEVMKLEQSLLTIERLKALLSFQLGDVIFTKKDNGFDMTWGGE